MNAFDTNILLYGHDTRDAVKQLAAQQAIAGAQPFALLWQVGCEFIAASRKLHARGFTADMAWRALADIQAAAAVTLYSDGTVWSEARSLQARFSLSVWDALLVAACLRGGVRVFLTEDMGSPRAIDSVSLVNPFLPGP